MAEDPLNTSAGPNESQTTATVRVVPATARLTLSLHYCSVDVEASGSPLEVLGTLSKLLGLVAVVEGGTHGGSVKPPVVDAP